MTFINTVTLKNDTNRVIKRVRASKEPVVVTQHGHPAVVIMPLTENDLILKHEKGYLRAVRQGIHDIKAGRAVSLKSFVQKHLH